MTNDPVDFYTRGYGGFGYDTSHVKKDEPRTDLFNYASAGNLSEVKRIVEGAEKKEKNKVINYARRWTEIDYKMSGFTKEWEWFDITPLAVAAMKGHDEVVHYLLEQGADPTLSGCPSADTILDAFQAARGTSCEPLLDAVKPFWEKANYSGVHYNAKSRKKFTNAPTDPNGMLNALRNV
jgi:hypothetical protein